MHISAISLGLIIACVGAFLAHTRGPMFVNGFSGPKMLCVFGGVAIALGFGNLPTIREWYKQSKNMGFLALFYLACILPSIAFSCDIRLSLFGVPGYYSGSLLTTCLCLLGLFLADRLESKSDRDILLKSIFLCGGISAVYCVMQHFRCDPLRFGIPSGNRAIGLSGSPIDMAALFVILLCFKRNPLYLMGILATGSRGAMVAGIVAILPKRIRVIGAVLATGICLLAMLNSKEQKDIARVDMLRVAVDDFKASPFFGLGPSTFRLSYDKNKDTNIVLEKYHQNFSHNAIADALGTRGIIGLIGLLPILAFPALSGLWVILMFNPISFEVAFVACVLAGLHFGKEEQTS